MFKCVGRRTELTFPSGSLASGKGLCGVSGVLLLSLPLLALVVRLGLDIGLDRGLGKAVLIGRLFSV